MKLMKKIFAGCIAFVMVVMVFGAVPSQKVYAASYPLVFMYEDSEFSNLCRTRTIECGSNTPLYFKWFRAYNYEKYSLEIFNSNNDKIASVEGTPPVSSIGLITLNWNTSDYKAGEYTVKVHKMFYSFYQWNEAPDVSTFYITLTRSCTHTWDTGTITKASTCISEGTKQYRCKVCGETKEENFLLDNNHTWDNGKVTKKATVSSNGKKTYTCKVCNAKKTKTIKKLTPTIKLSAKKKTIKLKKSYTLTISKLAYGDSIKSVKSSNTKIAKVKKQSKVKYKITGYKRGKATIKVVLKSGKKASCVISVK